MCYSWNNAALNNLMNITMGFGDLQINPNRFDNKFDQYLYMNKFYMPP